MATKFLKETIMTKIKDLATMTVDNAFLQFPVDEERYELFDVIRQIDEQGALGLLGRRSYLVDEVCRCSVSPQGSPNYLRVREFIEEVGTTVDRAYTAFVQKPTPDASDRSLTADRSRRFWASISNTVDVPATAIEEGFAETAIRFWFSVISALPQAQRDVYWSVPRTGRVST
jgi:hypothetical protein